MGAIQVWLQDHIAVWKFTWPYIWHQVASVWLLLLEISLKHQSCSYPFHCVMEWDHWRQSMIKIIFVTGKSFGLIRVLLGHAGPVIIPSRRILCGEYDSWWKKKGCFVYELGSLLFVMLRGMRFKSTSILHCCILFWSASSPGSCSSDFSLLRVLQMVIDYKPCHLGTYSSNNSGTKQPHI
jgi:hypothetical protein